MGEAKQVPARWRDENTVVDFTLDLFSVFFVRRARELEAGGFMPLPAKEVFGGIVSSIEPHDRGRDDGLSYNDT